ncbi:MAG: hypothetical protein ACYC64_04980 [Armatimonadota bacterium]
MSSLDKRIEDAFRLNIEWFERSGVMDPTDGSWGVAERIALTSNNQAIEEVYSQFPSYTPYIDYSIIEHRRPDCNFETALLFFLAGRHTGESRYSSIAENILCYLFRRSGTRNVRSSDVLPGIWRWANPQWQATYWLDDNSWDCIVPLAICLMDSDFADKLGLRTAGLQTAESLETYFSTMLGEEAPSKQIPLLGAELSPHFSGPAIMAFAYAYTMTLDQRYQNTVKCYLSSLETLRDKLTTSEHAYLMLGTSICASAFRDEDMSEIAMRSGDYLILRMGDEGNIPCEHIEAPVGSHLVDLIYTQNWATMGFHSLWSLTADPKYESAFLRSVELLLRIQDMSPGKHLHGCWRGMFDVRENCWGGGDKYEGGSNSIYSGWTNAPISTTLIMHLTGSSLLPGAFAKSKL